MTKMDQLFRRAAFVVGRNAAAISGKADVRFLKPRRAAAGGAIKDANEIELRLSAYYAAVEAAKEEDPPCPDCWIEGGEQLALAPIASDWLDEHRYGCMECGFEEAFPASGVRDPARKNRARGAKRAA